MTAHQISSWLRSPAAKGEVKRISSVVFAISDALVLMLVIRILAGQVAPWPAAGELEAGLAVVLMLRNFLSGHYSRRITITTEVGDLALGLGEVALIDAIVGYHATGGWDLGWLGVRWLPVLPALIIGRHLMRQMLTAMGVWQLPTLVVSGGSGEQLAAAIGAGASLGYQVAGVVDSERLRQAASATGGTEALADAMCEFKRVGLAVLDLEAAGCDAGRALMRSLRARGVDVALAPSLADMRVQNLRTQSFLAHDVVLLTSEPAFGQTMQVAKRLFDLVASLALLMILAPLLAVVAVAVKLDGGPLLFGHRRIGQNGRTFRCWKFRTMVPDAEEVLRQVLAADPARAEEWHQTMKLKDDPRVTSVGRLLRRTSLDELPQLFNVLCGEMSIVGPRPVTLAELSRYGDEQAYYLAVRPGITGLWQVSGRNDTSFGNRVMLDAWYVRNWSLLHDLAILIKTIPAVLQGRGAY